MRKFEQDESWVIYQVVSKGLVSGPNAVCEQAEWDEMEVLAGVPSPSSSSGSRPRASPSGWRGGPQVTPSRAVPRCDDPIP